MIQEVTELAELLEGFRRVTEKKTSMVSKGFQEGIKSPDDALHCICITTPMKLPKTALKPPEAF